MITYITNKTSCSLLLIGSLLFSMQAIAESSLGKEIAYLRLTKGYWQAWVTDSKGNLHTQITSSSEDKTRVSWFKNRKQVLVVTSSGSAEVIELETGTNTTIEPEEINFVDAQIGPDDKIIFLARSDAKDRSIGDLWMSDSSGKNLTPVVESPGTKRMPAWNADGSKIAFVLATAIDQHTIWEAAADQSSLMQLPLGNKSFDPDYSLDGRIAYSIKLNGQFDVWAYSPDTNQKTQITKSIGFDGFPSWSPDSKNLVFESNRNGTNQIFVTSEAGTEVFPVSPISARSKSPAWFR